MTMPARRNMLRHRIQINFTMNLMFWKKKTGTGSDAGDSAEKSQEAPGDNSVPHKPAGPEPAGPEPVEPETPDKPGLVARMKAGFAAVAMRFKKAPAPDAGENESPEAAPADAPENAPDISPAPSRKRLAIGGAAGLLVLALLGFAAWKIFPSKKHENGAPAAAETSHAIQPASHAGTSQAEIWALKEKNAELQTQIDALKKVQVQQQPPNPPDQGATGAAPPPPGSGEVTVGNKDPKAAAASLKEAIEAMNANSGGYAKKPANKQP
ncbi:MAG: hypothetical protein EPN14_02705 [Gallionella sp.]|nr:MAG: hypothetical protein EPN14_02705 [Gallionella sp.]